MSDRRFTQSEIEAILKGEMVLHIADREVFRKQREEEQLRAKTKREQEQGQEVAAGRYERLKAKVRREWAERSEREKGENEAINAMTPAEYDRWKQNTPPPDLAPRFQKGEMIALQDVMAEERKAANREREAREQELGLPKLQAAHAAKVEKIRDERLAAEAAADEAKVNAREREQEQLAELGDCPTLESLQVTA
jgi:hypothetical protein